jgi:hypothetical protein
MKEKITSIVTRYFDQIEINFEWALKKRGIKIKRMRIYLYYCLNSVIMFRLNTLNDFNNKCSAVQGLVPQKRNHLNR